MTKNTIQNFMTASEAAAYSLAASLSASNEPDRVAWIAGVDALRAAEARAIHLYTGEFNLNRHGQPHGGVHPALAALGGYLSLNGCYAPE